MENKTVKECSGTFTDTDLGKKAGNYAHNEDIIMTFCVPGAASIPFDFTKFCTENKRDILKIYQGVGTGGKLLGTYSGNKGPGKITIVGSCVTFHFKSDGNVACTGWEATWSTKVKNIPKSKILSIPKVKCKSTSFTINLDKKIQCDSLKLNRFKLKGNINAGISKITALNCSKDSATQFKITLDKQLNIGGTYDFTGYYQYTDICDSVWKIDLKSSFLIDDCPITVELKTDNANMCAGICANITAKVLGGNPMNYKYVWTPTTLNGKGPFKVCPKVTTNYKLTVSDGVSIPGSDEVTIVVKPSPKTMPDTTVCFYNSPFKLRASPAGGNWFGVGVDNLASTFDPRKAKNINRINKVWYTLNGCTDTLYIQVNRVYTGFPNLVCEGAKPFNLYYWWPRGGTWTGPNVTTNGRFTPPSGKGKYVLHYDWKGCKTTKTVEVIDKLNVQQNVDTICSSQERYTFKFSPRGGYWNGPARISSAYGIINPSKAGNGKIKYTYRTVDGKASCRADAFVYIAKVNAGIDEIKCSKANPFTLPAAFPTNGLWSGKGITDPIKGVFNPQLLKNNEYSVLTYTYTVNNSTSVCLDKKLISIRNTNLGVDTLKFCLSDAAAKLDINNTQFSPQNGIWTGTGISGLKGKEIFTPAVAGRGIFQGKYTINGCTDSLVLYVHPKAKIQQDTHFCVYDKPFYLANFEGTGIYNGVGITDGKKGLFDPGKAGPGIHEIYFNLPNACEDTIIIEVIDRPNIIFNGLAENYCFKNTSIQLNFSPKGGKFTGAGLTDKINGIFNPATAGSGKHALNYEVTLKGCKSSITRITEIADTLEASIIADKTKICPGEQVELIAIGKGGDIYSYTYKWSTEQTVDAIYVTPKGVGNFSVIVSDGCSDDAVASKKVIVQKAVQINISISPKLCYGEKGFAEITPKDADPYDITWYTFPESKVNRITQLVNKKYRYTVKNTRTGCVKDGQVYLPGYDKVIAGFSKNPTGCITNIFSDLTLFDHSSGAIKGTWYFGDGTETNFLPGSVVKHTYPIDTNSFTIKQMVWNKGGCKDSIEAHLCLNDSVLIFIPEIFTPDNFGPKDNEVFKVDIHGHIEFVMEIYNRWGEVIYRTEDATKGWDGTYKGEKVPEGIYQYKIIYKSKTSKYLKKVGSVVLGKL